MNNHEKENKPENKHQDQKPAEPHHKKEELNIKELQEKAKLSDEYLDHLQRLQADFENYRKRMVKEKEEFRVYALEGFLHKLLDVLDNFQRALQVSNQNHSYESLVHGLNIVEKQLNDLLKSNGVKPLSAKEGEKFDPHKHHAVIHESSEKIPADSIIRITQQGYEIGSRVLRPAMVVVSSGPKKKEETQSANNKPEDKK